MGWRTYLFMMDEFKKNIRINEAKVNNLIKYPNQLLSIETNISNSSSLEINRKRIIQAC